MERLVIASSRWKYVLLLLASLGFVVGGIFLILAGEPPWVGLMSISFFGSCALIFTWQLFDRRPRLTIDDVGILDRTLGVGLIRWEDILDAYVCAIAGNDFICLTLQNEESYTAKLSPVKRAMSRANDALGFSRLSINLSGIDAKTAEVFELVIKMAAQHSPELKRRGKI